MRRLTVAACAALVLAAAAAYTPMPVERPDMQVLESNAGAYPVSGKIKGGTALSLQKGERVKMMLLPSYRTQVFEGPPADAAPPQGGSRAAE